MPIKYKAARMEWLTLSSSSSCCAVTADCSMAPKLYTAATKNKSKNKVPWFKMGNTASSCHLCRCTGGAYHGRAAGVSWKCPSASCFFILRFKLSTMDSQATRSWAFCNPRWRPPMTLIVRSNRRVATGSSLLSSSLSSCSLPLLASWARWCWWWWLSSKCNSLATSAWLSSSSSSSPSSSGMALGVLVPAVVEVAVVVVVVVGWCWWWGNAAEPTAAVPLVKPSRRVDKSRWAFRKSR